MTHEQTLGSEPKPIPFSLRYECVKCGEFRMRMTYSILLDLLAVECDRCEARVWMEPKDRNGRK